MEEFEGRIDGTLVWPPRGTAGFGYDPIFLPDGHARTFGEMTSDEKHGLPPWAPACRIGRGRSDNSRRPALHRGDEMTVLPTIAEDGRSSNASAFGIYIHWPFCLSKCPYCDFNSHVRHAASTKRDSCALFSPRSTAMRARAAAAP